MNFTQNIIVIVMTLIVLGGGVFAWWNSRVADDDFSNTIENKDDEQENDKLGGSLHINSRPAYYADLLSSIYVILYYSIYSIC